MKPPVLRLMLLGGGSSCHEGEAPEVEPLVERAGEAPELEPSVENGGQTPEEQLSKESKALVANEDGDSSGHEGEAPEVEPLVEREGEAPEVEPPVEIGGETPEVQPSVEQEVDGALEGAFVASEDSMQTDVASEGVLVAVETTAIAQESYALVETNLESPSKRSKQLSLGAFFKIPQTSLIPYEKPKVGRPPGKRMYLEDDEVAAFEQALLLIEVEDEAETGILKEAGGGRKDAFKWAKEKVKFSLSLSDLMGTWSRGLSSCKSFTGS